MAKIFINTLYFSAVMMFLLFVSSGLPKVNGQPPCNDVGEGDEYVCSEFRPLPLDNVVCDASCKRINEDITYVGECEWDSGRYQCRCYDRAC